MRKYLFLFFLIILTLVLAGCGGECKENIDCDDGNDCTIDKCVKRECVIRPIEDCTCGNNKCETAKGENECTCSKDCGRCSGKVGDYLEKMCNDKDECVVDIVSQQPVVETGVLEDTDRRVVQAKIFTTYSYDSPFNLDKNMLNIKYELDSKLPLIRNLKIDKIQIMEVAGRMVRGEYPESKIIGEVKDANRALWDEYSPVTLDAIIEALVEESETKKVIVKTIYTYETTDRLGNPTTVSRSHLSDAIDIVFVNPTTEQACPPVNEWDDDNECTRDACSASTNFFVTHTIKSGVCAGNYICEAGENRCTTPTDCGNCKGTVGDYLRIGCVDNKCVSEMINTDVIEEKKIVDELSLPSTTQEDIKFAVSKIYDEPFDMSSSVITLKLEVMKKADTVGNFKITRMQLLEGNHELGFTEMSQGFNNIGEIHDLVIAADFSLPELQAAKEPVLKVFYSYDGINRMGQPVSYMNEAFEMYLPSITFVNAGAEI